MVPTWRKIPFLRWSFWRMLFGMKHLTTQWQVGDGREARLADYVVARARRGDATDAIRIIDEYCYNESFLINVGDEKGHILDAAVARAKPGCVLELGTYCGYSALRMAVAAPSARIVSIEFNEANAQIARRIFEHAGVSERVTVVVGTLGDGGTTVDTLRKDHGFGAGSVDLVFMDHDKNAYLPDLQLDHAAGLAAPWRAGRGRQREVSRRARVSGLHGRERRQALAHGRARNPRRVPVGDQGSRAGLGVSGCELAGRNFEGPRRF